MFRNLVKRDLRTRYKGSVLGFLWTFVNPLLQLVVFSAIFSTVLRMNVDKYPMFLFVALLPWLFFANCTQAGTGLILNYGNLIKKIYFPRDILPLANTTAGLINLALSFLVAFVALILFKIPLTMSLIALPLIMLIQYIFTLGFVYLLSALNVYFRDIEHLWGIIIMAWFYLTPIVYPLDMVPVKYLEMFFYNPFTAFILAYRDILYRGIFPNFVLLLNLAAISILVLIFGYFIFKRLERGFAEAV
ncbi:ABC transporter permease [Syntrophomonas palmitatica]|uniref:ABC transporter permease n=1 Tax=Syntrophomonas palmitatica TaxID=402877 RepID=UPI0009F892C4|nr:ABC transporter permease [Syntrophomonas palmitatica]